MTSPTMPRICHCCGEEFQAPAASGQPVRCFACRMGCNKNANVFVHKEHP